jgi:N-acylneuraminate cytidylyltransferase
VLALILVLDDDLALRPLAGRPLLCRAIAETLSARRITDVVVVGGGEAVADVAADAGARWVPLTAACAIEPATGALTEAAIDALAGDPAARPEMACVLDPLIPARRAAQIDDAIERLQASDAAGLVSAHPVEGRLWRWPDGGEPAVDADPTPRLVENGLMRIVRLNHADGAFATGRVLLYPCSPLDAFRVVHRTPLSLAEAIVGNRSRARDLSLLKNIRLLALDFDGVWTDNRVVVFQDGREAVLCNRSDGLGLEMLRAAGVPTVVISKERNPVVSARCAKLKVRCEQGIDAKLAVLRGIADEMGIGLDQVGYMGNDIPDLECMTAVGVAIAPSDAYPVVLRVAHVVTRAAGGMGAVREICDLIARANPDASPSNNGGLP